jgi:Cd2+/Zn2+-exporting ATPase
VVEVIPLSGSGEIDRTNASAMQTLLQVAASVEALSEHPLARAIEEACVREKLELKPVDNFNAIPGKGASASIDGVQYLVGSPSCFSDRQATLDPSTSDAIRDAQKQTLVLLGELDPDGTVTRILGMIAIADQLRLDADRAVAKLKGLGVRRVVMLTGDNQQVAEEIGRQSGVDEVFSELLPQDKVTIVKQLSRGGPVAMVGDGVNDAPALASSHVGIAMGAAGTDVAMETADIVLMSSNLHHLEHAIGLAHRSRRIVTQNLVFALGVIVVLVTCALTIGIPLPLGVVGHEGSTVLVCLNGLRLLRYQVPSAA